MLYMNTLYILLAFRRVSTLSAGQPEVEQVNSSKPVHAGFSQQFGEAVNKRQGLNFPSDHGAHHQQGIEWWYVTANLKADNGDTFGVQWTLFRLSVDEQSTQTEPSPWWNGQLYFAHFAIQTDTQHQAFEKYGRSGQVNITVQPFEARLDDWQLASKKAAFLPLNLTAQQGNYSANLALANSPLIKIKKKFIAKKPTRGMPLTITAIRFYKPKATSHLRVKPIK